MGLFNKLINMLSDEVEEEETQEEVKVLKDKERKTREPEVSVQPEETPAPKEEKRVVVEPKKEEIKTETESGLYQSPDTFKFPVFGDDEIEHTMSRSKTVSPVKELERVERRSEVTQSRREVVMPTRIEPAREEKKSFRPSPVISPVYGVLDKNYSKEDVIDRKEEEARSLKKEELTYDNVRRKAYGTLEDELEDTLMSISKKNLEAIDEIEEEVKSLEDPQKHIEALLDELEKTASLTVGEIEDAIKNSIEENEQPISDEYDIEEETSFGQAKSSIEDELEDTNEIEVKENTKDDEELENDLFNLIDSMYDEGDDK